jgi:hypothetical protein
VRDGYPVLLITASGDEAMMINRINEVTTRGGRSIAVAAEHPALWANVHDYLSCPTRIASCRRSWSRSQPNWSPAT